MNKAQDTIDEYGTLQVSAPVLTYSKSNDFQFSFRYGATNYFNDAKASVQGRAAGFEQVFRSFLLQGKAEVDPTVIAAYSAALASYQEQMSLYSLKQNALLVAAQLELQAALVNAATNTSATASNQVQAWRTYAEAVCGSNGAPVFPTAASFNTNLPSAPTNLFGLLTDTNYGRLLGFLPFLALNTNQPTDLRIPDRSAVITAAGDNAVEAIFRALGDSSVQDNFANKEKFFGLSMVSVDPGWRTQKGWAGEVVVFAELEFRNARTEVVRRIVKHKTDWPSNVVARILKDYDFPLRAQDMPNSRFQELAQAAQNKHSLKKVTQSFSTVVPRHLQMKTEFKPVSIVVVSPITDNDTLDLASSYRKQTESAVALSFALRYAGAAEEASAFEKFARSRQFDISSRTPLTAVNAFSGQGGLFGFQIGPRVRALEDPASRKSGPGQVLERQTFPALILVGMIPGDLEPRLTNDNGRIVVYEPYITLRQMRRWVPMKRTLFSSRDWYRPKDWYHPRLSEGERLSAVDGLEKARGLVSGLPWNASSFGWTNDPHATLFQRVDYFEEQLIGSLDRIALPAERVVPDAPFVSPPRIAQITSIDPDKVTLSQGDDGKIVPLNQQFILWGKDLDVLQTRSIRPLGSNAVVRPVTSDTNAVVVLTTITNAEQPLVFCFELDTNKAPAGVILSPAVRIGAPSPRSTLPRVDSVLPSSVVLERGEQNQLRPLTTRFALLGVELKQIDTNGVDIATGHARVLRREAVGDGLVVEILITNTIEAVTLKLPLRGRGGDMILSRPITVLAEPAKQPADKSNPQTLRVEQKADAGNGATSIAVTVAPEAKPDAIEAAAKVVVSELEKKKPGLLLKDQRVEEIDKPAAGATK